MTTVLPTFCTEDKTLNVTSCVIQVVMCFSLPKFFEKCFNLALCYPSTAVNHYSRIIALCEQKRSIVRDCSSNDSKGAIS